MIKLVVFFLLFNGTDCNYADSIENWTIQVSFLF